MEIKKEVRNILYCLTSLYLLNCSQNQVSNHFFIKDNESDSIMRIKVENLRHVKNNIYEYQKKIYLAVEYTQAKLKSNNVIKRVKKGMLLCNSFNNISIDKILDIDSYKTLLEESIYSDKDNLFILKPEGCHNCLKILDINTSKLKILDEQYNYATDETKIYCLRYGNEVNTKYPKTFQTVEWNEISFGIDSMYIYSMCQPMLPKDFKNNFQNIPSKIKDSIVNKYFGVLR